MAGLLKEWTAPNTLFVIVAPWVVLLLAVAYYYLFKRVRKVDRAPLAPLVSFFTALTAGATTGFDQDLMKLFHPALLRSGSVERGVVRAMARCLRAQLGELVAVPRDTVVLRRSGLQVNCAALAHFSNCRGVKVELSWVERVGSVAPRAARPPLPPVVVDGVPLAPPHSFHVTRFHVVPPRRDEGFSVLDYLDIDDFEPFAERFVEALFARPPAAAVPLLADGVRETYETPEGLARLQAGVDKAVAACGGLCDGAVDAVLVDKRMLWAEAAAGGGGGDKGRALNGMQMIFQVHGARRHARVTLALTLAGLACRVFRYSVDICADERLNVVVDQDGKRIDVV